MSNAWRVCAAVVLFFSRFGIISGYVNLSASPFAVFSQSYTFQCSVSEKITLPVVFVRNGNGVCTVLSSCREVRPLPGYSCKCAGQTGTSTLLTLTINRVSLVDETKWTCGYDENYSRSFHLQVHTPVNYTITEVSGSRPNSLNITEGDSAVFTCVVQGAKPAPTVSQILWYVDSNKLPVSITGSPTTTDRLTTLNVTYTASREHDDQKVFCAAENNLMIDQTIPAINSSNKLELHIQSPPDFPSTSGECPDTYIESGQSGTCVCNTTFLGTPAGTVSWITPDGTDTQTQTLVLKSINRKYNNQNYTCQVRNYVETRNLTFTTKLAFGPDRTDMSGNQAKFDVNGTSLTVTCKSASSSPSVTFTWRNLTSGQILISNEPIREQDAGDGGKLFSQNLVLVPQWYQDGDEIECEIQNSQIPEQNSKTNTILSLIYPPVNPPEIRGYKTGQVVYEGDTLNIRCVVSGGKPLVTSVSLSCDTDHRKTSSERDENNVFVDLSFTVTRNLNTKTCQCSAVHQTHRYNLTDTETLTVYYAPDLTFPSLNTTENTSLNINCSADGRPDNMNFKHFKHYWNDMFIQDVSGTKVTGNQYRLKFNPVTFEDSGIYVCSVENGIPDRNGHLLQNKTSSVYVEAAPKIINKTDNIVGAEIGNPVVLHKSVFCKPNYTNFTWSKFDDQTDFNNTRVTRENITLQIHSKAVTDSGYKFSLSISNFTQDDIGTYKLTVCNEVGCSQFSVNLTGASPPLPPKEFQQERESTSDTVFLSWLPNYPGGNFKQRFILQYKPQSDSNWITVWQSKWFDNSTQGQKILFNITNLQPKQVYNIRLSAESNRLSNNTSKYVTLEVTTKGLEEHGISSAVLGAAVGGAVGSVTVIVVIVTLVLFLRRHQPFVFSSRKSKDAENGNPSSIPAHEMPVLEENDLYYTSSNEGVRNIQLPVLEDNVIYHTNNAASAGKVQTLETNIAQTEPGTSRENVIENPERQYSVVIKNKCKQSNDAAKKEKEGDERKMKNEKKGEKKANTRDKKKKEKAGDKRPLHQSSKGDTYENVGIGKEDNTYANAAYSETDYFACEDVKGAKHGGNKDGLLYVGIDFSNTQPSKQVHKTQDKVEYVSIDWNKKAEPLPDEDDKQTEPKT